MKITLNIHHPHVAFVQQISLAGPWNWASVFSTETVNVYQVCDYLNYVKLYSFEVWVCLKCLNHVTFYLESVIVVYEITTQRFVQWYHRSLHFHHILLGCIYPMWSQMKNKGSWSLKEQRKAIFGPDCFLTSIYWASIALELLFKITSDSGIQGNCSSSGVDPLHPLIGGNCEFD